MPSLDRASVFFVYRSIAIAALITTALSACNSSGTSTPTDGTASPPQTDVGTSTAGQASLYYVGTDVMAVNPATPSAPPISVGGVAGSFHGAQAVYAGTYDAATGDVTSVHTDSVVWVIDGGIRRGRVNSNGVAIQNVVSSEQSIDRSVIDQTSTTRFCGEQLVQDWANPNDSWYLYFLAGSDRTCSMFLGDASDVGKMVRVGAPASEAPIVLPSGPRSEIRDPRSGALTGWLAVLSDNIVRTNTRFGEPVIVKSASSFRNALGRTQDGKLFVFVSNQVSNTSGWSLYRFDPASNTFDAGPFVSIPGLLSMGGYTQDEVQLYFSVYEAGDAAYQNTSIYRLPLNAANGDSAVKIAQETDGYFTSAMSAGPMRLTYQWTQFNPTTSGQVALTKSVAKNATTVVVATELVNAATSYLNPSLVAVGHGLLYVNSYDAGSQRQAHILAEDGTVISDQVNAQWIGVVHPETQSTWHATPAQFAILAASSGFAGAALWSFDMSNANTAVELGALGADTITVATFAPFGPKFLLGAQTPGSSGSNFNDAYFVDASTPGSLLRLTQTRDLHEEIVR